MPPSAIRARFDGGFLQTTCLAYCALRLKLAIAIGVLKIVEPGYFMNCCRETMKMGVPPGNSSRGTAGLVPRRT
jgi:hypothetical protein